MGSPTPRGACGSPAAGPAGDREPSRCVYANGGQKGIRNRPFGRVKQGRNAFSARGPTRVADPLRQHDEPSVLSARRRRTSRHLRHQGRPPPRKPVRSCSCTLANPRAPRGVVRLHTPSPARHSHRVPTGAVARLPRRFHNRNERQMTRPSAGLMPSMHRFADTVRDPGPRSGIASEDAGTAAMDEQVDEQNARTRHSG